MRSRPPIGLLSGVLGAFACLLGAGGQAAGPDTATVQVVAADANQVIVDLVLPRYDLHRLVVEENPYTIVTVPGLAADAVPGAPLLPRTATLIAVPPGAEVTLHILDTDVVTVALDAPVLPAPQTEFADAPLAPLPVARMAVYTRDTAYANPARAVMAGWYPATVASAGAPVTWRSQRVVAVQLNPIQVNAGQGTVRIHRRLRVAIEFVNAGAAAAGLQTPVDEGPFEAVLAATLANYQGTRTWRSRAAPPAPRRAASSTAWWRVVTGAAGIYTLDCTTLAGVGFDLASVDLATIQLFRNGQRGEEIAIEVNDANRDGRCDPGSNDGIVFYAEASTAQSSATRVYWLTHGVTQGKRVLVDAPTTLETMPVSSYVQHTRLEQNRLYYSYVPLQEGADHWYWDVLSTYTGASRTYTATLDRLAPGAAPATLDVMLAGYDGRHHTQLLVNDHQVADIAWQGRTVYTSTTTLADGVLQEGANTLRVVNVGGAGDYQYVNALAIAYPRRLEAVEDTLYVDQPSIGTWRYTLTGFTAPDVGVFDVTDPADVRRVAAALSTPPCPCQVTFTTAVITPHTYLAVAAPRWRAPISVTMAPPSDLLSPAQGADYLIIAPTAWLANVAPLAHLHAAEGLRVRVVDVQMVYDTFGDGSAGPDSLRAFLAHAVAAWPAPAPTYVLLVGDGSYDPRGYVTADGQNPMPAYLRLVDPWLGETASDNQLVALDPGSNLPSLAVGRLPATTAAELDAMVAKIIGYAKAAPAPPSLAVVAGAAYNTGGVPDAAGNFWEIGDRLAAVAAGRMEVTRLYYNPCPAGANPACALPDPPYASYTTGPALTSALSDAFNRGQTVVAYAGHGAPTSWAGNPTLWSVADVARLQNGDRLPITLDLTCYTGHFQVPARVSLAEAMLRQPAGGAAGVWASSGQGVSAGYIGLAQGFLDAWLTHDIDRLGLATVAGKAALWAAGDDVNRAAIDTYHLFGDPALRLPVATTPAATPTPTTEPTAATPTATVPVATPSPTPAAPLVQPNPSLFLPYCDD